MPERRFENAAPSPWRVPIAVEDVAETGQRFDLIADAAERAAVAKIAGLRGLLRLQANFEVMRHGTAGLHVVGQVSATVEQTCVITLEQLANEVVEQIDLIFAPIQAEGGEAQVPVAKLDETEPLIDGSIDLGALAVEFVILGLDPYPRKPGAVFEPLPDAKQQPGPFAALAVLKKGGNDR